MSKLIADSLARPQQYADGPRLLADIGGTNARFALETAPGIIEDIDVLACADYAEFTDAVAAYLGRVARGPIRSAAIAIATPVRGDSIRMTNHHWQFSIEASRRQLHLDTLLVVNDFTALAMALPHLRNEDAMQIGGEKLQTPEVIGLVGAGTGLGVGGLLPIDGRWAALNSEGGHASFSPANEQETAILHYCWRQFRHVSAERLVSGPGIALIHEALCHIHGDHYQPPLSTPEIVQHALAGTEQRCVETIHCFCGMLGTVASNVAITLGAIGGVFIGGGIVLRLGETFAKSAFRARFENKGRFGDYLAKVPVLVITARYPAFLGVAEILRKHLDRKTSTESVLSNSGPWPSSRSRDTAYPHNPENPACTTRAN